MLTHSDSYSIRYYNCLIFFCTEFMCQFALYVLKLCGMYHFLSQINVSCYQVIPDA